MGKWMPGSRPLISKPEFDTPPQEMMATEFLKQNEKWLPELLFTIGSSTCSDRAGNSLSYSRLSTTNRLNSNFANNEIGSLLKELSSLEESGNIYAVPNEHYSSLFNKHLSSKNAKRAYWDITAIVSEIGRISPYESFVEIAYSDDEAVMIDANDGEVYSVAFDYNNVRYAPNEGALAIAMLTVQLERLEAEYDEARNKENELTTQTIEVDDLLENIKQIDEIRLRVDMLKENVECVRCFLKEKTVS